MTEINRDKLNFLGTDPIDKVVVSDALPIRRTVAGPSGHFYTGSDNIQVITADNPYKKKVLCDYKWSVDNGATFNSPETILKYSFTVDATALGGPVSDPITGFKAAVDVGVDANSVYFQLFNGWHGNVTYTLGDDVFSSFPQDFLVEYVLFEVE